jgi:hypothetical protein
MTGEWLDEGPERVVIIGAITALWEAQIGCPRMSQSRHGCLDSCRELLMFNVSPALLPAMPERRAPRGDEDYDSKERRLLLAAAGALHRVDKEAVSLPLGRRDTLGSHARLIENAAKSAKPEPATSSKRASGPVVKVRGLRHHGAAREGS